MKINNNGELSVATEDGTYQGFKYEFINGSSSTCVKIHIPADQSMEGVPGCMVSTSENIDIKGKYKSSLQAHFFEPGTTRYTIFTAKERDGWVVLAPAFYGSVRAVEVKDGADLCVGDDCYLGSIGDIETSAKWQGDSMKKALFSGHGYFVKKVKGNGIIFVCAVGSLLTFELSEDNTTIVDNGHLVTWPSNIKYTVEKASSNYFGSIVSGEGWVLKFHGPGQLNVQTGSAKQIALWVNDTKKKPILTIGTVLSVLPVLAPVLIFFLSFVDFSLALSVIIISVVTLLLFLFLGRVYE